MKGEETKQSKWDYSIEEGVLIPSSHRWQDIAGKIKPGNSVKVRTYNEGRHLYYVLKKKGFNAACRKMDGYYRVWRLK